MRLYFIRHAESANNAVYGTEREIEGHAPDPEITDTGHRQGRLLGQHLADKNTEPRQHPSRSAATNHYGLTHIYCSLMTRSLLTAQYISRSCGVAVSSLPDLFERKGLYSHDQSGNEVGVAGPGRPYFETRFPGVGLPDFVGEEGWWSRPVETDEDFFQRVRRSLDDVIQRHGDSNDSVAMVVHGDYIDQCLNEFMGVHRKPENYETHWVSNWVFHNTSISRLDIVNGSRNVVYLNRIDHLPAEMVTW